MTFVFATMWISRNILEQPQFVRFNRNENNPTLDPTLSSTVSHNVNFVQRPCK